MSGIYNIRLVNIQLSQHLICKNPTLNLLTLTQHNTFTVHIHFLSLIFWASFLPWASLFSSIMEENVLSIFTVNFRSLMTDSIILTMLKGVLMISNFYNSPLCHNLSKADAMSNNILSVLFFFCKRFLNLLSYEYYVFLCLSATW